MGKDTGIVKDCPRCNGNGRIEMLEHCPNCKGKSKVPALNRFSDIWMGIFLKRKFDELGWAVYSGASTILHTRASDAQNNYEQEKLGREWNEWIWKYDDERHWKFSPEPFWDYMWSYKDKRERFTNLITSIIEKKS
jgi:hypothetical protein